MSLARRFVHTGGGHLQWRGITAGVVICVTAPLKMSFASVSYTHLDVYKRQLIHTAEEEEEEKKQRGTETVTNIGRQEAVVEMQVLSYNVKQEAATSPATKSWFEARKCFHIIAIQCG